MFLARQQKVLPVGREACNGPLGSLGFNLGMVDSI